MKKPLRIQSVAILRFVALLLLLPLWGLCAAEKAESSALRAPVQPARVALMVPRDMSAGWVLFEAEIGMRRGCGELLIETLSELPEFQMLDWSATCGLADLVNKGLYRFSGPANHAEWSKLCPAEIFVEYSFVEGKLQVAVHASHGSKTTVIENPLQLPKKTAATIINLVFEMAGYQPSTELRSMLADPETSQPELFLDWMRCIGYKPSPWNDDPYGWPNKVAAAIIKKDPKFLRGLAWAVDMRLRPIADAVPKKTKPANPIDFDLNVFTALDYPSADYLIPSLHARLIKEKSLRQRALSGFALYNLDADPSEVDEGEAGGAWGDMGGMKGGGKKKGFSPRQQLRVIKALSSIDRPEITKLFVLLSEEGESPELRTAAVQAFGAATATKESTAAVVRALSDRDAMVRRSACRAAKELKIAPETWLPKMLADRSALVRQECLAILAGMKILNPALSAAVLPALSDKEAIVRTQALRTAAARIPLKDWKATEVLERAAGAANAGERIAALEIAAEKNLPLSTLEGTLVAPEAAVRVAAVRAAAILYPQKLETLCLPLVEKDDSVEVQRALAKVLAQDKSKAIVPVLRGLMKSTDATVRDTARSSLYSSAELTIKERITLMLGEQSMRVNAAALRLIDVLPDAEAVPFLQDIIRNHHNEYTQGDALARLVNRTAAHSREACLLALQSPYLTLRLRAAGLLRDIATPEDIPVLKKALQRESGTWQQASLEDALATATGKPATHHLLHLGKRKFLEGGENPAGWQIWLGGRPSDPVACHTMVQEGYRFGLKTVQTSDTNLWNMQNIDDSRSKRGIFLVDLLGQLENMRPQLPDSYYLCLFDEPMSAGGGDTADCWRAFVLETGRPELLAITPDKAEEESRRAFAYWRIKRVGDISNWVVNVCRDTVQREFPDLRIFPQSLSYMGLYDAFDMIDGDGDYTWRYTHDNLMGDYGLGAVNRALRPGQPVCLITWLGSWAPSILSTDIVRTNTKFPPGPWRFRGYMGICSALALYASGVEAGYFNMVQYAPITATGRDRMTYPLTPYSPDLRAVIETMIKEDSVYWNKRRQHLESEDLKTPMRTDLSLLEEDAAAEAEVTFEEAPTEKTKAEKQLAIEQAEHFKNAMSGCSYMNIFDTDITRAMANLPRPSTVRRPSLVIFSRQLRFSDQAYFAMPALALLGDYDIAPTYDSVAKIDLDDYDTILLQEGNDGVTPDVVKKINQWLRARKNGLLYVWGDVNASRAQFPELARKPLKERFLWEDAVQAMRTPLLPAPSKEKSPITKSAKKDAGQPQFPAVGKFSFASKSFEDQNTQMRTTYAGKVTDVFSAGGKAVLAQWTPQEGSCTVLFDGANGAGSIYTGALEEVILALDKKRGSSVRRNPYWGHVGVENEQFVVDVATRGYTTLQNARPRQHTGVDIITGVINPLVKNGEAALILKNYVGPYAGGLGDWAVMARSGLKEMALADGGRRLELDARGVTRVTHIGAGSIRLLDAKGFTEVKDQLAVWEAYWQGKKTYSVNSVDGGVEFHFFSSEPIILVTDSRPAP